MQQFILCFATTHPEFRLEELESISSLFGFRIQYDQEPDQTRACMLVSLPSEKEARQLGSRCILIKSICRYWTHASSYRLLHERLKALPELWEPLQPDTSFKFAFQSINKSIPSSVQVDIINSFGWMKLEGEINMSNPEIEINVIEEHERGVHDKKLMGDDAPSLQSVWIGSHLCYGRRDLIDVFKITKRSYFGNTTMDSEVSLLMANQAQARPGSLVYDPFAGTGSMLYTAAWFGSMVTGSDIDGRHMRGSKDANIKTAAEQYKVRERILDLMTFDYTIAPWRTGELFDAIVTDPPYGVRAGAKRQGRKDATKLNPEPVMLADGTYSHLQSDYVPPSTPMEMSLVLTELLDYAVRLLKPGGRLVYMLPTITDEYQDSDVPLHPSLRLIGNSPETFNKWQRRLITMQKLSVGESQDNKAALDSLPAHHGFREKFFSPSLRKPDANEMR